MRSIFTFCLFCVVSGTAVLAESPTERQDRWQLDADGGITWNVRDQENLPHTDHIEMSGGRVSVIVEYGLNSRGASNVNKHVVWPMLRTIPNDTHASLSRDFDFKDFPEISVDGRRIRIDRVQSVRQAGLMTLTTLLAEDVELTRILFPSPSKPAVIENCTLVNRGRKPHRISVSPLHREERTDKEKGVYGEYVLEATATNPGNRDLAPGEKYTFSVILSGRCAEEAPVQLDPDAEEKERRAFVAALWDKLIFTCPNPVLERAFAFAKIRAAESIFDTRGGLMHGPGGGSYYAAIWANDQAEYANPFFAYLGDARATESAINAYRHFARFMNDDYNPIPSSIIAEGTDTWHGAGDRGDGAMIAYGASRFALANGDRETAEQLWPLITWCLEFCNRKLTSEGVVASDSDELEGRFPAGKANLCTSSLYYDGLLSAAFLAEGLGKGAETAERYRRQAGELKAAIEAYFGADIEGFPSYRYYDGNDVLRAWICIPLAVGIHDRAEGTINALFSPRLWTEDGLASQAGDKTFWDRSTLYGMRGVFAAGATERCLPYFEAYSRRRLLGDHVPYPVEAYPEGNKRHLSAESALYCRVVTEGLFGLRPSGLRGFTVTPRLPKAWDAMSLQQVHAFGHVFNLAVNRVAEGLLVVVTTGGEVVSKEIIEEGKTVTIMLGD